MAEYTFGQYRLDLDSGELYRDDKPVAVRAKCFRLLVYFVRQPGKLIAKETLLGDVWSSGVVSESALTRTIAELRSVLLDNADEPEFIETVQRRGYRFIAPVRALATNPLGKSSTLSLLHHDMEYPLTTGSYLIGRERAVAIPLYNASTSRRHARIIVTGETVVLEDLGSRNGTLVNGQRVTAPLTLNIGDVIEIGGEKLILWSPFAKTVPPPM